MYIMKDFVERTDGAGLTVKINSRERFAPK